MYTNEEILKIAMRQSAWDLGCDMKDFLKPTNVVVRFESSPLAKKYYEEPIACNFVSYGNNLVLSVKDEYRKIVEEYIRKYDFYHCFETPNLHWLNDRLRPLGQRVCFMAEYFLPDMKRMKRLPCDYRIQVLEQQEQIFQKMLKTLDHKKTLYDQESTGERFRSLSNQMNRVLHKAKQLEDLHRILNDSISAAAHSRAQTVHQAAEAAGQHTQGLKTLLDAWGTEPGSEQFGEMDMEILDKAQSSDLLARIARYLGPCRELMHEQRNNGYTYRRGEKCGITLGSQIQQALSSELAYLAHPVTAPLFLHKISRRQVRQYKRRERISLGAGDVIVCVDESGSTEFDDKDAWAKAIAYALVDKVGSQGRCASVIHFSSASEVSEDLFIPGQYTSEDVMNSARHFYCGGTNYEAPLRKAVSTLDSGVLSKADIVFITDGQCSISSVFQDWLCAKLSEHHASITGVLLDSGNNFEFSLKGFCKTIYRTSELAPSEILSELVLS